MAQKSKARSAKKKTAPKKKASDEKQFEQFVKTARELGIDETGGDFERNLKKVLAVKKQRA